MTLSPRWRKALLTVHIATAVSWLGADAALFALAAAGLTGTDPQAVYPAAALVGSLLLAPLSFAVWVVGVLSGLLTRWGLFTWWWVLVKLVVTTVMVLLVVFLLVPNLQELAGSTAPPTLRQRWGVLVPPTVSGLLLLLLTTLSTYKPWGRLRPATPAPGRRRAPTADRAPTGTLARTPR